MPFVPLAVDKQGIHPRADIALLQALYHWYRHEKPDIIHHFTIKPVIYGSIAARLAGVPRIVNTVTGLGYVFMAHRSWLRHVVEWQYRSNKQPITKTDRYSFVFASGHHEDLWISDNSIEDLQ
ncbi:MAG TPA: glycosyltransferase, partial [Candidatus Saccharimonadia bacterium]|nr:glycosyltransferase [Candidatus Saccharimonadia bacterium]